MGVGDVCRWTLCLCIHVGGLFVPVGVPTCSGVSTRTSVSRSLGRKSSEWCWGHVCGHEGLCGCLYVRRRLCSYVCLGRGVHGVWEYMCVHLSIHECTRECVSVYVCVRVVGGLGGSYRPEVRSGVVDKDQIGVRVGGTSGGGGRRSRG